MDFIDTHLHLIYRGELGYGWTAGIPALAEGDFTLEDYAGLAQGRGIAGALFMEAGVDDGDFQAEARLIAGLVGRHGLLGQIAACRPEDDAGEIELDAEAADGPEPLAGPEIDLGEVAAEQLGLAIDPYPRRAGAEVPAEWAGEPAPEPSPPEKVNPFAALGKLKKDGDGV